MACYLLFSEYSICCFFSKIPPSNIEIPWSFAQMILIYCSELLLRFFNIMDYTIHFCLYFSHFSTQIFLYFADYMGHCFFKFIEHPHNGVTKDSVWRVAELVGAGWLVLLCYFFHSLNLLTSICLLHWIYYAHTMIKGYSNKKSLRIFGTGPVEMVEVKSGAAGPSYWLLECIFTLQSSIL